MSTLEKAIEIAAKAHAGAKEKNGDPYLLHPLRVMAQVNSLDEKMVAVLHDVAEDTDVALDDLEKEGFSQAVLEAVRLVTRTDEQNYNAYIQSIKANPIARAVKIADMIDNSNLLRIPNLRDKDLERCRKYHKYIQYLNNND